MMHTLNSLYTRSELRLIAWFKKKNELQQQVDITFHYSVYMQVVWLLSVASLAVRLIVHTMT